MSWIVEAPNNNPSVFVLISSTVFQNDGVARTVRVRVAVLAMLMLRSC
jgi:hypothetical protein